MRRHKGNSFLLCFLINLLLNFEWSIPAWIALALHLWLKIPNGTLHKKVDEDDFSMSIFNIAEPYFIKKFE